MLSISPIKPRKGYERDAFADRKRYSIKRSFQDFLKPELPAQDYRPINFSTDDFLAMVELPIIPMKPKKPKNPEPMDLSLIPYGLPSRIEGGILMNFNA